MADDKLMDAPAEVDFALKELDWSLEALQVQPFADSLFDRVVRAESEGDTTEGYTCNFKCGDTAYWECGPSSDGTCEYTWNGASTCVGACVTQSLCITNNGTSPCICH